MMSIDGAINILESHNKWRRGDKTIEQTDPILLGMAIDLIIQKHREK